MTHDSEKETVAHRIIREAVIDVLEDNYPRFASIFIDDGTPDTIATMAEQQFNFYGLDIIKKVEND